MPPIPFGVFMDGAKAAMKATDCKVKAALSNKLARTHPNPQKRYDFVESAAKAHDVKAPASSFLRNLGEGTGDMNVAAAVWYELHCSQDWKHHAEDIDRTAFGGQTFEEAFAEACAKYLEDSGRWRLVGDEPLYAVDDLQWNFDLFDRQPAADGKSVGVYLEAAAGLEKLGDNMFGFAAVHIKPRFGSSGTEIEVTEELNDPQPAGNDAAVLLVKLGRTNHWSITSSGSPPLHGIFRIEQAVMTIDTTSEPVTFTAQMIARTNDLRDQFGNEQLRDVRDAVLQALYAKNVGKRDERTDQIVLCERKYVVRQKAKRHP